jgi:hypothetical protein
MQLGEDVAQLLLLCLLLDKLLPPTAGRCGGMKIIFLTIVLYADSGIACVRTGSMAKSGPVAK